jgi:hypothetical protein
MLVKDEQVCFFKKMKKRTSYVDGLKLNETSYLGVLSYQVQ